jgi:hypothetical protein
MASNIQVVLILGYCKEKWGRSEKGTKWIMELGGCLSPSYHTPEDIGKGKISFQSLLQVVSFIII